MKNNNNTAILFVAFALAFMLVPSTSLGDRLRGSSAYDDILREAQLSSSFFSFLSIGQAFFSRVVALILSLPAALLQFLLSLFFSVWNIIAGAFLSLSIPFTTTTLAPTTMLPPLTTTSAATTSSTLSSQTMATLTFATSTASGTSASSTTTGSLMMSSLSATETRPTDATTVTGPADVSTSVESSSSTSRPTTPTSASTLISATTSTSTSATTSTSTSPTTTTTFSTTASTTTRLPSKTVFVTSQRFNADMGGLEGADAKCNDAAIAANLPGRFLSWISNVTVSPLNRFTRSTDPYVMVGGSTFANNFTSLISDGPLVELNVQEGGQIASKSALDRVWTNTGENGSALLADCGDWSTTSSFAQGIVGSVAEAVSWSNVAFGSCADQRRLFCFEQ